MIVVALGRWDLCRLTGYVIALYALVVMLFRSDELHCSMSLNMLSLLGFACLFYWDFSQSS
jgi:hypothetical protein